MFPESAHQQPTAAQALRELLGDPPTTVEAFFDLVTRRPVLLSSEAAEILDGFHASLMTLERDESSLSEERHAVARLCRTLRDCRAHGIGAVRRVARGLPADQERAALAALGLVDMSRLGSVSAVFDRYEGAVLLEQGRTEQAVERLKRATAAMHRRGWRRSAADTEMLLWDAVRRDRATDDLKASLVHVGRAADAYREAGDQVGLRRALRVLAIDSDRLEPGSPRTDHYLALITELDTGLATWLRSYIRGTRLMWSDSMEAGAALRWCVESIHLVGADLADQEHWRYECARKLAFIDPDTTPETTVDSAMDRLTAALLAWNNDRDDVAADHLRHAVPLAEQQRRSVVTEVSQVNLSRSLAVVYHAAASAADRAGHPTEPLDLLELNTSRSLLSRMTMHRLWVDADTRALVQPNQFKRQAVRCLTDVERRGGVGERRQLDVALLRLREALGAAEREVLAAASTSPVSTPPVTAAQLAEHLRPDDTVVVYTPIGVVYAVTRNGVSRVADFDAKAVERLCVDYRRLASAPGRDDGDPVGAALEASCVEPVRAAVAGRERVFVVPGEPLWGVPLATVGTRPLDSEHLVSYVPSMSVLHHLLTRPHRLRRVERFAGVGDPDGSLPHAAVELADAASRFYDRTVQVGPNIDFDAFLTDLPDADVVHVASHGFTFDEFPDLSALHVAGEGPDRELLWAPDLVRLNLRARLVVLAACHAGLSRALPGNEYVGLPGVLLVSGARAVLGPLWQVDDRVTARFMAHFYDALPASDPADALRRVQRAVRAEPATAHPYYWAAFQLFGVP